MSRWETREGKKWISRNVLANGNIVGGPRGYRAHSVASLVGYDAKAEVGSRCILQGMELGYIAKDARIYGIERELSVCDAIEEHAAKENINMKLFRGEFKDFIPERKLDMMILDLMGTVHDWVGKKLCDDIVPMMSSRRAGIGVNVNIQRVKTTKDYKSFMKIYQEDTDFWNNLWMSNPQQGTIDIKNPIEMNKLFSGIKGDYELGLPSFIGIHKHMINTKFKYAGSYEYYEPSSKGGTQYMLSLRYETSK